MFIGRATSDLHLTKLSARWVWNALEELRQDAKERGGPTILVGDILDQPTMVHMPSYNRLREELQSFPEEVYVIVGNHDQYRWPDNALEPLAGGNVKVISEPTWTDIGLMVPYQPADEFWDTMDGLDNYKPDQTLPIWWTHQGWKGAWLNNMVKDKDGLSLRKIRADLVITGHYHAPHNVGKRVMYCGSPYQTSFAEEGQAKFWFSFNPENNRPSRIEYKNVGAPKHITIHWDPSQGEPEVPEDYVEGDKLRIFTEATRSEAKAASGQLKSAGLTGVAVLAKPDNSQRGEIEAGTSAVDAVRQFIDKKYGDGLLDPNADSLHQWAKERGLWG